MWVAHSSISSWHGSGGEEEDEEDSAGVGGSGGGPGDAGGEQVADTDDRTGFSIPSSCASFTVP
jgi:hypothetical protein